jgi:hypothetical protein
VIGDDITGAGYVMDMSVTGGEIEIDLYVYGVMCEEGHMHARGGKRYK